MDECMSCTGSKLPPHQIQNKKPSSEITSIFQGKKLEMLHGSNTVMEYAPRLKKNKVKSCMTCNDNIGSCFHNLLQYTPSHVLIISPKYASLPLIQ